jgi:hypothetical protein
MLPPSQIIVYLIYSIQIDIFLLVYLLFVFFGNNIASLSPYDDICLCLSDLFRRIFLPPVARDLGGRGAGDRNGGERNGGERDTGVRITWNSNARERDTRSVSPGIPMPESAIPESALPGTAMPGVWMLDTAMPRTLIPGTGPDVGYSRSFIDTIKRQ